MHHVVVAVLARVTTETTGGLVLAAYAGAVLAAFHAGVEAFAVLLEAGGLAALAAELVYDLIPGLSLRHALAVMRWVAIPGRWSVRLGYGIRDIRYTRAGGRADTAQNCEAVGEGLAGDRPV